MGHDDLLYVGNDFGSDCLARVLPSTSGPLPDLPAIHGPHKKWYSTMGADFLYAPGDVVQIVTSDFFTMPHLFEVSPDGSVAERSDTMLFDVTAGYKISWGVASEDFDGDRHPDLAIAHGAPVFGDPLAAAAAESLMKQVNPGGVMFVRGGPDGFVQDQQQMPDLEGGFYATIVADLVGQDGRGDGCPDLLVTPLYIVPADPDDGLVPSPERMQLLVCDRARPFVGVRLPLARAAASALVALHVEGEPPRWIAPRMSAGMAGSRDPIASFTVGADDVVTSLVVHWLDGTSTTLESPERGRSHARVVQSSCARQMIAAWLSGCLVPGLGCLFFLEASRVPRVHGS